MPTSAGSEEMEKLKGQGPRRLQLPLHRDLGLRQDLALVCTAWGIELGMPHSSLACDPLLGHRQEAEVARSLVAAPDPQPWGGRGCSSPSGQGVLRTVHLRISLVSEQTAWSPPGAWRTRRIRSSEPLRKPQSFFFLEHGPHGDHSVISH